MKHLVRFAADGIVAALLVTTATAQTPASGSTIIPLYLKGSVSTLGVPEIRERQDRTGGTLIRNVSEPSLELFRPAAGHANGTAVIVAPGGGFVGLAYDTEGTAVARLLARRGVTAFVLKYRTIRSAADPMQMPEIHLKEMNALTARARSGASDEVPRFAGEAHAVEDGVRAMAIVRRRASEWGLDSRRIGFLGFSAGAFLAVDLAIGETASRPDFVGLIYGGLRTPVPADAPPAFIAGAANDEFLPNDPVLLYTAWRRAGVAAELHVFERGRHGFGLAPSGTTSDHWLDEFVWWMQSRGLTGRDAGRGRVVR